MFRDFGPALQLFRIESERLKLPAPFSRRIAEPLDADAAGQATFHGCLDKIRGEEGEREPSSANVRLFFPSNETRSCSILPN